MKRIPVDVWDYAGGIARALEKGALLTAKADGRANSMVIGWGHLGRIWEKPVFVAYVREGRFTRGLIDRNPEFTVNVALQGLDPRVMAVCGSRSGRDTDKLKEAALTCVESLCVSPPAIAECPLTLECRVAYREVQEAARLPRAIRDRFYTSDTDDHIAYWGVIEAAYLLEV